MSDAPNPPARRTVKAAATAPDPKADTTKPEDEGKEEPKAETKEEAPKAAPKPKAKAKKPAAPKPPKTEIVQTSAGPANKGGWNEDFRRGWEDFENGLDNRADYRGDPAKLKAKDAYISGHTGASNYARLQKAREAANAVEGEEQAD